MADAETVLAHIQRVAGVVYTALTPNIKGMERAVACHHWPRGRSRRIN